VPGNSGTQSPLNQEPKPRKKCKEGADPRGIKVTVTNYRDKDNPEGRWYVSVMGGTYPYREQLKKLGFRYSPYWGLGGGWFKFISDIDEGLDTVEALAKELPIDEVTVLDAQDYRNGIWIDGQPVRTLVLDENCITVYTLHGSLVL